ncbi:uncharacterized protein si:dkey-127k13.1 [Thalassophryne amazonica]|uniref:uncharacterized protein si:dkey-127k13.1 n=1 Tax=Thalassophryne amazonica TaxID=390379 RepID=UPI0014716C7C|nr:uncharacterized protein si:dkey-127k13.1 [Thalassophryne amazonica]
MAKPGHTTVKGRTQTKNGKVKKNTSEKVFSANVSPVVKKGSMQFKACSLSSTPKRGRKQKRLEREACLTSTPVHSSSASDISTSRQRTKRVEQQCTEVITRSKTSGVRSSCNASKSPSRKCHVARPTQVQKKVATVQKQACSGSSASPVECRRGKERNWRKQTQTWIPQLSHQNDADQDLNLRCLIQQSKVKSVNCKMKKASIKFIDNFLVEQKNGENSGLRSAQLSSYNTLSRASSQKVSVDSVPNLAFDTVSREGLWKIMEKFGCPGKFITIVRQFHYGMMVKVLDDGDESAAFIVTSGVKTGLCACPYIVQHGFSAMLTDAFRTARAGISSDIGLMAGCSTPDAPGLSPENLLINKTEVMYQPAPRGERTEPAGQFDSFTYLGRTLSRAVNINAEINNRIAKASAAFGSLRENVWEQRGLSLTTKLKVYHAVVLTTPFSMPTSGVRSSCNASKSPSRKCHVARPTQVQKKVATVQKQACSGSSASPVECRRGKEKKLEKTNSDMDTATQPSKRCRPRFELEVSHTTEQDESAVSSDLSIELSHNEQLMGSVSFKEEDDDEEELPSFLMQENKKSSITKGQFVWCKYRSYPLWPALVKSVNCKMKKASIKFIDNFLVEQKNGLTVALKTLKPFDCEEANDLVLKAKENYDTAIEWSIELINDYRMRIACRSFSGSFIEYFVHDMSYPVRRKYPQVASERFGIISDVVSCDESNDDSFSEHLEEKVCRTSKRLLPDRTCAAHNRANEKLVHFIVKQRMVDQHLLAVICGRQQSRWLRSFLSTNRRRVVSVYLEDDRQVDEVYMYLSDFHATALDTAPCLAEVKSTEHVSFVLDVLLPEAIICAIAGVEDISLKKAEEKYLKGRCISNRERQEFDLMIEQHVRTKL